MAAVANADLRIHGLPAIGLENDWLKVSVLPDVGAKIFDLIWKPTGKNFLWHNPRISPQPYPVDGNFDNYWCGGWDDGFPTCDACEFRGEQFPNLGELRSLRWRVESVSNDDDGPSAKLSAFGPISPVHAEKTVKLAARSPLVQMLFELTNLGPLPLDFIWGTHPALQPNENMILRVPAKTGVVGQASDQRFGKPGQRYRWPNLETESGVTDMGRVGGISTKGFCGHYALDLEAGWYAVEDMRAGEGFLLRFPLEICPYLWMWLVYGGWRGYYHVILEPWTSYPNTLAQAVQNKTHRRLQPGEKFSVDVRATVYANPETWEDALRRVEQTKGSS